MEPSDRVWDVRCLLCSRVLGQIVNATFHHDPRCGLPLRISGGHLRCCRCGGSLIKEPATVVQTDIVASSQPAQKRQASR